MITKIYHIEYKNILFSTKIYFIASTKIFRLHAKIFESVHQNNLDCVSKYFRKTWGLNFIIMIKRDILAKLAKIF